MIQSKVLTIAGVYCWTCGTEGEAAGSACAVWRINWMAVEWALQCSKTMAGRWNEMSERKLGYRACSIQEWLMSWSWIGLYQKAGCRRNCAQTQKSIYSLFNYTHQHMHVYILFKKSKIFIKTFKMLLHVSITRSSSASIYCSLLKL